MNQLQKTPEGVKEEVRQHYGAIARERLSNGSSSGCCSSPESNCGTGYSVEELSAMPNETVSGSLGCGNPVALASLRPGEVVLDLGSGGGLDVLLAAQRVGPEGFAYGVDMTDEMLELATRNAEKAGIRNVRFLKGEIEAIPLPGESVDVIMSNCVINLSPDKGKVLQEAFRVLKPGGRLAVTDIVIEPDLNGLPVDEATIRAALDWAGCIAGAPTKTEYERYLAEAGFTEIAVTPTFRYSTAIVGDFVPAALLSLPRAVQEDLAHRFTSSTIQAIKKRQ
jgi:arsenite methyltransferase